MPGPRGLPRRARLRRTRDFDLAAQLGRGGGAGLRAGRNDGATAGAAASPAGAVAQGPEGPGTSGAWPRWAHRRSRDLVALVAWERAAPAGPAGGSGSLRGALRGRPPGGSAAREAGGAAPVEPVRFGFTVGKRNARRAVDRNLVRRILREAARHARPQLAAASALRGRPLDLTLRLRAPLQVRERSGVATRSTPGARARWRQQIRFEADELLAGLATALERAPR